MDQGIQLTVTPEKIKPFLKKADDDQTDVLYRLAHHVIRGCAPGERAFNKAEILEIMQEGNDRQRMLIIQAAYHMIRKKTSL